jgi:hypothetical protein
MNFQFSITCFYAWYTHLKKIQAYSWDKTIFSSDRILHKDYDSKDSVGKKKKCVIVSLKGLGGKPPVVK